jgi:hypothetical protein
MREGARCQVCADSLTPARRCCPICRSEYHPACGAFLQRCSSHGCGALLDPPTLLS